MRLVRQKELTQTRKKRVLDALKTTSGADARRDQVRTLRCRPPLYRFQEIFHAIKTGRYPNRTKLAADIEVTTKTIQRDLDYMRYQLGLPIEFDYCRGGYYFTQSVDRLPLFELTEGELVSLFVAQKALRGPVGAREDLAQLPADPGADQWRSGDPFYSELLGRNSPLDSLLGRALQGPEAKRAVAESEKNVPESGPRIKIFTANSWIGTAFVPPFGIFSTSK